MSRTLDTHAFGLSKLDVLCFVSSLQSPEMIQLHKVVGASVVYRFFRYVVFLPASSKPLANTLGACRLLLVTPLDRGQVAFDVMSPNLLSKNCSELYTYAQWSKGRGFHDTVSPLALSPVIRKFGQKQLRVGYVEYSPFSVSRRTRPAGAVVYEGVDFSLIFNLADIFNMSLVPVRDPEATWGAKRKGRWTGIAGMVSRREVDLAVSASFQTPYREEVLDYTHYYYIQVVKFIVRAPAEKPRALVIVRPFVVESRERVDMAEYVDFRVTICLVDTFSGPSLPQVWVGVLAAYLVSLALLVAVMRIERRHDRTGKLGFLSTGDVALSLYLGIIWQGCDRRFSASFKRRLVAASWWLLCTVISCAYCSVLISFMSHPGMEPALDTLPRLRRELLAGRIFVGTTRHTEMELAFTSAKTGIMRDIGRQMLEHPGRTLVPTEREGYSRCLRSRYAYMFPETVLKVEEARTAGRLLVSRDAFYHAMAVYTFPKGSPHVATFSYGMKNFMFMGLVEKWLNDFLWQLRKNTEDTETEQHAERPINVVDLQGAFFVVVMGYASGLLALVTESCCMFIARRFRSRPSR